MWYAGVGGVEVGTWVSRKTIRSWVIKKSMPLVWLPPRSFISALWARKTYALRRSKEGALESASQPPTPPVQPGKQACEEWSPACQRSRQSVAPATSGVGREARFYTTSPPPRSRRANSFNEVNSLRCLRAGTQPDCWASNPSSASSWLWL